MKPTIKLALVGGSSTGKTTLLTHLEEQFTGQEDVVFVHESARQFFTQNQVDNPFDFENQEKILELALLNEKLAMDMNPKVILTDTSALEVMFYTRVQGNLEGSERLQKRLEDYIPTYSKFLIMNPDDVRFENDTIRREDKATRDTIHAMLTDFYRQRHLPYELISGTVPERSKRVRDIITTYLNV